MIQVQTQTADYWVKNFSLTEEDIEQIYNHFLEQPRPHALVEITKMVMRYRVEEERSRIQRRMEGRITYQPQKAFEVGSDLVFPAMRFVQGTVTAVRPGYNPEHGEFNVIAVEVDGKTKEFASNLKTDHILNNESESPQEELEEVDVDKLVDLYGAVINEIVEKHLQSQEEFIRLAQKWFIKSLMVEVNVGHLHLAEAVLEMSEGGPLETAEIVQHLDMDAGVDESVKLFSLNYGMLQDERFDEVAPPGAIKWFLKRLEPPEVSVTPERLRYEPIPHDRALLSPQLLLLERELDDEWSELDAPALPQPVVFTLTFPHRAAGTLPLSSRIRPLFPVGRSTRQQVTLVDEETQEEITTWAVHEARYVTGLADWYNKNSIPIGGFIHLKPTGENGKLLLGYDKRRAQREWVRLATVQENHLRFELSRRAIGCGYDDLLIVGTDVVAAVDALFRRVNANQYAIAKILADIFPDLAELTPQKTVHAKTLYSTFNMLKRVPPGPIFAELVRHPAFQQVGDHYWQFDRQRWKDAA